MRRFSFLRVALHDCQLERLFYAAKQEPGTYSIYECAPNADLWTSCQVARGYRPTRGKSDFLGTSPLFV